MGKTEYTIHFWNGDSIKGCMNASPEAVCEIYSVNSFHNIGLGPNDNIQQVRSVEIDVSLEEGYCIFGW